MHVKHWSDGFCQGNTQFGNVPMKTCCHDIPEVEDYMNTFTPSISICLCNLYSIYIERVIYAHTYIKYIISQGITKKIKLFCLENCINGTDSYSY